MHWVPPMGLQMDVKRVGGSGKFIRATFLLGNIPPKVYEDEVIAALHTGCIVRSLKSSAVSSTPHQGVQWSWVPHVELLNFVENPVDTSSRVTIVTTPAKGDGRCSGLVIGRDIVTGEETVYSSATDAADKNNLNDGAGHSRMCLALMQKLVDAARPANGKMFRSTSATKRWELPVHYKRDPEHVIETWPKGGGTPWIVMTDADGAVQGLYETMKAASRIEGIAYATIRKRVSNNTIGPDKMVWRRAKFGEYGAFVDCEQT